jgi:Ca-activated chloride channel family protein
MNLFKDVFYLHPDLLGWIPVAAALAMLLVGWNYRRKRRAHREFGKEHLLAETSMPLSGRRYLLRAIFAGLAAASIMVALAQPVIPNGTKTIARGTVSVIGVVDVSRSMAAFDYPGRVPLSVVARPLIDETGRPLDHSEQNARNQARVEEAGTRLEMARHILLDYMLATLDGNQLGIVSFAGKPFPQAFLTTDFTALRWVIDRGLTITSAPGEGSALAKALDLALIMFDADAPPTNDKLIVLFSDGGNDDDPAQLADFVKELRQRQIKLVVVGLGNLMPSKIAVNKLADDDDYARALRDSGKSWYEVDGEVIKTGMDIALLQGLANQARGEFIHLQSAEDFNLLKYVGKTSLQALPGRQDLFPWALGCGLIFLVLAFTVTQEWRLRRRT